VQYSGVDLVGCRDVAPGETEHQIEGLLREGFYVGWGVKGRRLFLRVWEYGGPEPGWPKVYSESPLIDRSSGGRG
jgi:hypothetical protein